MGSTAFSKHIVLNFYDEIASASAESAPSILQKHLPAEFKWYGVYPFNEQRGPKAIAEVFWTPFLMSWSNVQRRQDILIAGTNEIDQRQWVISMGHLIGLFDHDWLGIRSSRKLTFLRYADFYCVENERLVAGAFFCDLIGVMQQGGVSPLPPQTGSSIICPGPQTHDGLLFEEQDPEESDMSLRLIKQHIADMSALDCSGNDLPPPEYLAKNWHENMLWYGPAGIGTTYTIPRYQEQHQYPFRTGLTGKRFNGHICRFAEGNYAGFFGWPNLTNTPTGGFLGLPASDRSADMRVVDIYRREGDKIAENWVLIDLPWWLYQQGVDVLKRTEGIFPGTCE